MVKNQINIGPVGKMEAGRPWLERLRGNFVRMGSKDAYNGGVDKEGRFV
jgi:hypothetical protein